MRVGYYIEDPSFPVHPPVRRALDESAMALAAAGHEIIVLKDTPSMKTAIDLSTSYWSMDNNKVWLKNIEASGEPIIPSLQKTIKDIFGRKPEGKSTHTHSLTHSRTLSNVHLRVHSRRLI